MRKMYSFLGALTLSACAVGPDYRAPQTADADFIHAESAGLAAQPFEAAWWKQFDDPVLDSLIGRALESDLDVRIAVARVAEARALVSERRRDRVPAATTRTEYEQRKTQQPGFTEQRIEAESYQLGFDASWELDLFGAVRRGIQATAAEAQAAEAGLRDAQVLVAAEVARNYLELRGVQRRLDVARANLTNQRETLQLTRVRLALGRGSELDVASAEARFAATEASIPPLLGAEQMAAHRLAVLLGLRPGELDAHLSYADISAYVTPLAIGEPDALLRRRPDIRAAERELAAATARIGVAEAELFPRVSLSGFLGFIAGTADQLGDSASRAWSATPVLTWAAFDLTSVRARLHASEARAEAALATYEQTVLRALEETENAFVTYAQNLRRLEALVDQAQASRRAAELARIQYREGALDFLRLLDAERTVLEAEDSVARAETDLNTSVVAIYKALGGGWESSEALAVVAR